MILRSRHIIFTILILSFFSCKKGEFPENSYDVPKIYLEGKIDNQSVNFIIGNGDNISTSYYIDTIYNGEYRTARYFVFDFKQFEKDTLKRTFKIKIKNCKDEVGSPDENMWCTIKNNDYKFGYSESNKLNYVQPLRVLLSLEEYDSQGHITKMSNSDNCNYNENQRFSLKDVRVHNFDGKSYLTGYVEFNCYLKNSLNYQIDSLTDFKGNIAFGPLGN